MSSRVVVEDHFEQVGVRFDQAMKRALVEGGKATAEIAKRNAPKGETGRLASRIYSSHPHPTQNGWQIEVYAAMFYGRFLEDGTLGSRRKKLKQPERRRMDASAGTGIPAQHFMQRSGKEGESAFAAAVEHQIHTLDL